MCRSGFLFFLSFSFSPKPDSSVGSLVNYFIKIYEDHFTLNPRKKITQTLKTGKRTWDSFWQCTSLVFVKIAATICWQASKKPCSIKQTIGKVIIYMDESAVIHFWIKVLQSGASFSCWLFHGSYMRSKQFNISQNFFSTPVKVNAYAIRENNSYIFIFVFLLDRGND